MAIVPGLFNTPMMEGVLPDHPEKIAASIPVPDRLGAPEQYALLARAIGVPTP